MRSETKKGIRFYNLTPDILVRLAGIEPTTPWFVAKYSIQLSYSRLRQDYSRALQNGKGRSSEISQLGPAYPRRMTRCQIATGGIFIF